jgi:UDP-N-acetylmuramate--alanine ligase
MNKVFFIGIKGVGMTALALAMQDAGWSVSGCDTDEVFITDDILHKRSISISRLNDYAISPDTNLIVCSAAYVAPNTSIPVLSLAQALSDFVKERQVIAVAGVGGKTTTTAMLAAMFRSAGRDIGYYVGTSTIAGLSAPGSSGTDPIYVIEADEYAISKTDPRPKFALLSPKIVITTNIVHDHPDIYPNVDDTRNVFAELITHLPTGGAWIYSSTDHITLEILALQGETLKVSGVKLIPYNLPNPPLVLSVFGDQNQLDAQAAILAGVEAGLTLSQATQHIKSYHGAGRRQEFHGEVQGRLLYDDYGHHPGEIELTVNSFKQHFPDRRILLVFESHTYSRTESLLADFSKAIALADLPFIMPIFESAREKGKSHSITPASFTASVAKYNPAAAELNWDNAAEVVWAASRPGDIILTMGAGFVYKLHESFKLK